MEVSKLFNLAVAGQWAKSWASTWGQTDAGYHTSSGVSPCEAPRVPAFEAFTATQVFTLECVSTKNGTKFTLPIWEIAFECGDYYGIVKYYVMDRSVFVQTNEREAFLEWCESHHSKIIDRENLAYQRALLS